MHRQVPARQRLPVEGDAVPSEWHDAFVGLVKERPGLPVEILRDIMGVDIPDQPVWLAPEVLNDRPSSDLITDKMILVGPQYAPVRVILVEVQAEESADKRRQIPRYAMAAWLWFKCYIDVLVICPDEKTATWYAEPLPTALDDCLYRPKALLPSRVPAITDPGQVAADPDMAVLSVAYHGQDPAVAKAFVEGIGILGPERGEDYYEYANVLSPQQVRDLLEAVMTTYHPPRVSALAKRHYGEGFAEGESKGERHTIRMVLKARGLSLTDDQSNLIEACNDLTTLRKWSEAALTAKDASDIFD